MIWSGGWLLAFVVQAVLASEGREIVVEPKGPFATLTEAIRSAADGDRIVVRAGVYREPVIVVDKRLVIQGEGGPIFDGQGLHQVLTVTADSVTIRGLIVRGVGPSGTEDRAGIKVLEAHGCDIEDNVLVDTYFGVYLSKTEGCVVRHNQIRGSGLTEVLSGNGIHSWSSSRLFIEGNDITGHRDGIYFEFTSGARVANNQSHGNLRYGLHFMFSDSCDYTRNVFEENGAGVAVMYSRHITMHGNDFSQNRGSAAFGLLLKDISDSRIEGNRFAANSVGLHAEGTNRLEVIDNEFDENGWAVRVMADAVDNEFRGNRFRANSFDVATNSPNASTLFAENYWDRYTGYDLDRDGFGDVPFAPVRLFALVVQQHPPAIILLKSPLAELLDAAERVLPVLTPQAMLDRRPRMIWVAGRPVEIP